MGKNSHEFLLSTTSCNVFSKNTRVSIVKLGQTFKHLDSFRARCQTPTWPPSLPHWRSWVCFPCVLAISNRLESCSAEQLHVLHLTGIQKVQQPQVGAVMANPVGGVGWMQSTVWRWSPAGRAHPTGCALHPLPQSRSTECRARPCSRVAGDVLWPSGDGTRPSLSYTQHSGTWYLFLKMTFYITNLCSGGVWFQPWCCSAGALPVGHHRWSPEEMPFAHMISCSVKEKKGTS